MCTIRCWLYWRSLPRYTTQLLQLQGHELPANREEQNTFAEQAEFVRQSHYHQHLMQSTFPLSVFFLKNHIQNRPNTVQWNLCQPERSDGSVQGEPKYKQACKQLSALQAASLQSRSLLLASFQPIQWLSELQQYSLLLAFENFSLHRFRDLAICLIKCPSFWDRVAVFKFLSLTAPKVFSPQADPVLLQKASI